MNSNYPIVNHDERFFGAGVTYEIATERLKGIYMTEAAKIYQLPESEQAEQLEALDKWHQAITDGIDCAYRDIGCEPQEFDTED